MTTPATNKQIPDHSIFDHFNKQVYLGNEYIYALGDFESTATAETPLLAISNPSISSTGFPVGYKSIFINLKQIVSLTTGQTAILRYYLNPTGVTGGTPETPINLRSASSNTSIATVLLSPTVSTNGTIIDVCASNAMVPFSSTLLSILDVGQSGLITLQTSSSSTFVGFEFGWYEL